MTCFEKINKSIPLADVPAKCNVRFKNAESQFDSFCVLTHAEYIIDNFLSYTIFYLILFNKFRGSWEIEIEKGRFSRQLVSKGNKRY